MQIRRIKNKGVNISIILSLTIIAVLITLIMKVLLSIDFKALMLAAGETLEKDASNQTNFLIIGTGTDDHDGADLTDTMIVASLDHNLDVVTMVSIPRDLHIEDDLLQVPRINEIFYYAKEHFGNEKEGLDFLIKKVEELTGIPIHYHIKIDFKGFTEIIDAIGGVDIDVPEAIYDPFYPKAETISYELFQMSKGLQHMDGSTALKYARSRKTTSDFDRSKRQQQIIYALKDKTLQTRLILDTDKLKELLNTVNDNIETNLNIREMLTLGALADNFSQEKVLSFQLHDDPVQCGGFLYAPPLYQNGGAFVLKPAGGVKYIQKYFDLITKHQPAFHENLKIQILNGTPAAGIAAENKQVFQRYCMDIERFGNARSQNIKQTTIYYNQIPLPKEDPTEETKYYTPFTIELIKEIIPEAVVSQTFPQEYIDQGYDKLSDIIIEIGEDYVNSDHYLEDSFYPLYSTIYAEPTPEPTSNE